MSEQESTPFFSIVIPTYNRPQRLRTCLGAIAAVDDPGVAYEVIVVDDGGDAALEPHVAPFRTVLDVQLVRQENAGPASARNRGVAHARGEYVVFTDDDCALAPDYLIKLRAHIDKLHDSSVAEDCCIFGGHTTNVLPNDVYAVTSQLLIDYFYGYYNRQPEKADFFTSNNFALSRQSFEAIGGFDTSFPLAAGEDREFCRRWLAHGGAMHYVPEVIVHHAHGMTLRSFWRQHFNYGRGAFHFHQMQKVADSDANSTGLPAPLSFYFNLLLYPLTRGHGLRAGICLLLMLLTQFANTAGFFWARAQQKR